MNRISLVRLSAALLLVACALCACAPRPTIATTAGDLTLRRTWFGDRWPPDCGETAPNCDRAMSGYHILYASFAPSLGGDPLASGSAFSSLLPKSYIESASGARIPQFGISVNHSSVILAFAPKIDESGFKLCWPENPCVDLGK